MSHHSLEFTIISDLFCPHEAPNWLRFEWELSGTIQTLCDVRRAVEKTTGNVYPTIAILNAIKQAQGIITNRLETETPDLCLVSIPDVIDALLKID